MKLHNLLILVLVISTLSVFSQNLPQEVKTAISGKQDAQKLDIFINFGKTYIKNKQYKNSGNCYIEAGKIYNSANDKDGEAWAYNKAGKSFFTGKNYSNAISAYTKAKNNYKALNKTKNTFNTTYNLADVYTANKKYSKAISNYTEAYNLIKGGNNSENKAYILNSMGVCYSNWGKKQDAYKTFNKALPEAQKAGLTALANNISKNLETAAWNKATTKEKTKIQETHKQEADEAKQQAENAKQEVVAQQQKNLMNLQEIENLSVEMQAEQYKLHAMNEKYEKEAAINELNEIKLRDLRNQKLIKELELVQKENENENQRKILLISIGALIFLSLLLILVFSFYRQKRKSLIVVNQQKEELNQQNEEILTQRDEIEDQRDVLNKQHGEITDSIKYAEKIQKSILPSNTMMQKYINDFFVYFSPKNIVSGDFYWFYKKGDEFWGAVVDCTGHGVPGAFMSMIGNSLLNKIILQDNIKNPSDLLLNLNKELDYALNQNKGDDTSDDGMDMTVVKINIKQNKFTMALANHTALVVKDGKLNKIEGDIFSIGGLFSNTADISFTNHIIDLTNGASIYMFSDGYQDQFGGNNNKKYSVERLEEKILAIQDKSLDEQNKILKEDLKKWQGNNNQIDDILIVGVRF